MTAATAQRQRLLRLRQIEHRVSLVRLADADRTRVHLSRIADRLVKLKEGLGAREGETTGITLQAMTEMSVRLMDAERGLERPIYEAEQRYSYADNIRLQARQKEEGAEKLAEKARQFDEAHHERRTDANRPFRRKSIAREKL